VGKHSNSWLIGASLFLTFVLIGIPLKAQESEEKTTSTNFQGKIGLGGVGGYYFHTLNESYEGTATTSTGTPITSKTDYKAKGGLDYGFAASIGISPVATIEFEYNILPMKVDVTRSYPDLEAVYGKEITWTHERDLSLNVLNINIRYNFLGESEFVGYVDAGLTNFSADMNFQTSFSLNSSGDLVDLTTRNRSDNIFGFNVGGGVNYFFIPTLALYLDLRLFYGRAEFGGLFKSGQGLQLGGFRTLAGVKYFIKLFD
jgi:hypothetical protein